MIGVRVLDYRSKSEGIERLCSVEPAKDRTLLVETKMLQIEYRERNSQK